jgi:hypothetical protein
MCEPHRPQHTAGRDSIDASEVGPIVADVMLVEDLPLGSAGGSRRAVVRWSDGTTGEALRWYPDEIHIAEAELVGKTRQQLRSLHFRRDGDWLRS